MMPPRQMPPQGAPMPAGPPQDPMAAPGGPAGPMPAQGAPMGAQGVSPEILAAIQSDPRLMQLVMALMGGGQGGMPGGAPQQISEADAMAAYRGTGGDMNMPRVRQG